MTKLIDEFRRGWQGISQPSLLFSIGFAVGCLVLATMARWGLAQIRPDVFFTPYFPAVFFATAVGGFRIGIATAIAGGALGVVVNFSDAPADPARFVLLLIFWAVCGLTIWGVEHYRTIVAQQREDLQTPDRGRGIPQAAGRRAAAPAEEQDIDDPRRAAPGPARSAAGLGQHRSPDPRAVGDRRSDRAGRRQRLRHQGHAALRTRAIRPCPVQSERRSLFLPAKLAVSLALIFHELATNAGKYGAFSSARGLLQVSWTVSDDRLNVTWDETEGPAVENVGAAGLRHQAAESALRAFDGKTEIRYLKTGVHCTMQCRIPAS